MNPVLRGMVSESSLTVRDFIYPMFAVPGKKTKKEISSMPGQFHFSVDELAGEAEEVYSLGIPAVMIFGIPPRKDETGSEAYAPNGIVQEAVRAVKKQTPELLVVTDVCLCEYTSHGHCGVFRNEKVENDPSLELLAKAALSHCEAGADMVAPSDMMDGRVRKIRSILDGRGFQDIPIMSYSAKYASAFYGPFREAAESAPQFGDRKGYQMDPANAREALVEAGEDADEGADILMVKPALGYGDVIRAVKERFNLPVACYNVSAEYAMVKAAALKGWIDGRRITLEILTGFKRAGADLVISYHAKEAAFWLQEEPVRLSSARSSP